MTLELHIWGPAFGLPSIDAGCLAAIAYLRVCLPSDQYRLVPSSSPASNPLNELPALRDGKKWTAGFGNIVSYLDCSCETAWHPDEHLGSSDTADCTAYTSFIQSRGQPLLDLSLYVSTDNYNTCTKPALASLLQWPDSWFVPHRLRDRAKKTSEHLGLDGLDVDSAQDEKQQEGLAAQIPESLRKPKQTVSALLGHDTRRSKFRLDAVTTDFFEPLEELLGEGPWLISDRPTRADCLAVGYLALMQASADGAQPWLKSALSKKFSSLDKWAQTRAREWFGEPVSASSVLEGQTKGHVLPWQKPASPSAAWIANALALDIAGALPLLKPFLTPTSIDTGVGVETANNFDRKQRAVTRARSRQLLYSQVSISTMSASILAAILFYKGILRLPDLRRPAAPAPKGFGTAGDFLGLR